ncbi:MAG: hypothetical protein ABIM30_10225 [candidate division WOR-3 bacterium]
MISVTINNKTFNIPEQGQEPGWGEDVTAYLVELANVINFLTAPGDIINSVSIINNNVTTPSDVLGMQFSNANTRSARVTYQVKRQVTGNILIQSGTLYLDWNPQTSSWTITEDFTAGNAGITFSVTASGQVRYTTTNMTGSGYQGEISFSAKTLPV